jgi:signal transduction histidine kinase
MDNALIDRLILYVLCTSVYLMRVDGYYAVVPILVAVILGEFSGYFENVRLKTCCFFGFAVLCLLRPEFILFLPVLSYDMPISQWWWLLFALAPIYEVFSKGHVTDSVFTLIFVLFAMLMKHRTATFEKTQSDYIGLRDTAKELSMRLSDKNKELRDKQDYEVNVATLNERNRIARDIHDSVGHLLSSAILQVGALMAVCPDDVLKLRMSTLKETLSQGMDDVRASVHQLYDESIDLYTEIRTIVGNFTFCPVTLDYDVESDPDRSIKYAFIAVLKEALSNVMRHSNATAVNITVREHPGLYQLIIKDNGSKISVKNSKDLEGGIGLANIAERISALRGILNINDKNGYTLFISVPKGR